MKRRVNFANLLIVSMIAAVLMLSLIAAVPIVAASGAGAQTFSKWGPKVDYVLMTIYGTYEAEVADFEAGKVDIIDWPLEYDTYQAIKSDPNYVVEPLTMYDFYDIDINNLRWPTSDVNFRRALAYLINYETFYTTVLKAYSGELMDNIIWKEWTDYYNPSTTKYYFNETKAQQILAGAGYFIDADDNMYDYTNSTGTYELPSLDFYVRSDDPLRKSLGEMYAAELNSIGIPVTTHEGDSDYCSTYAYETYNYNLYTAGAGPFTNPLFLYTYYTSQFGVGWLPSPWAPNNVFFTNSTFDDWATILNAAPDKATAIQACKKCQEIFMDQVPLIPVYHSTGSTAYRAKYGTWSGEEQYAGMNWTGMVNSITPITTSGVNDQWTLNNAHPAGVEKGGTLRYGLINDATVINPVMEYWYWDGIIINMVYDTLLRFNPLSMAQAQDVIPDLANGWTVGVWNDSGVNATVVTFNLCRNVKWNDGQPFNSTDVAFTMKYMWDAESPLFSPDVMYIKDINTTTPKIETPDPYTVKIYFDIQSMWALQWVGLFPIIPKHVWESINATNAESAGEYETTGNLTGTGPYYIVSHKTGETWVFKANPNYFRQLYADINCDLKVDIKDLVLVIKYYGSYPGSVKPWNADADINGDDKVDIKDLVLLIKHYGTRA